MIDKLARITRVVLVVAIAVVAALIITTPHDQSSPFALPRANADVVAAPGHLMLTMPATAAEHLYITDTTKQVICVYSVTGDQLKLVSARKYDFDTDIPDSSIKLPIVVNGKNEQVGGNVPMTRAQAEPYGKEVVKGYEKAGKK